MNEIYGTKSPGLGVKEIDVCTTILNIILFNIVDVFLIKH